MDRWNFKNNFFVKQMRSKMQIFLNIIERSIRFYRRAVRIPNWEWRDALIALTIRLRNRKWEDGRRADKATGWSHEQ